MYAEGEHNVSMTSESHRPSICGTQIPNLQQKQQKQHTHSNRTLTHPCPYTHGYIILYLDGAVCRGTE